MLSCAIKRGTVRARLCSVLAVLAAGMTAAAEAAPPPRQTLNFDAGWRFLLGDPAGAEASAFDDSTWRELNLPHDWSIELPFDKNAPSGKPGGYATLGIGWYRKVFDLPRAPAGSEVWLQFDGVMKDSQVWLNGHPIGHRYYGYSTFYYDITKFLRDDALNVLAVRVDNSQQTSRWYTGSGIYRDVWLTIVSPVHVTHWGTTIETPVVGDGLAAVRVTHELTNHRDGLQGAIVDTTLVGPDGAPAGTIRVSDLLQPGETRTFRGQTTIEQPALWSPQSPALYEARTRVTVAGRVVDAFTNTFGIRVVEWSPSQGLLLNHRPLLLNGVCLHHDLGCVGAAFWKPIMERRLRILRDMGANAIRTSHNPPAPGLLDLADRLGFMVIDEAFDKWGSGYRTFEADWRKDLRAMIERDRNHPSVILWSVGNEVRQQNQPEGPKRLAELTAFAHELDPTRRVTAGTYPRYSPEFVRATDIPGLNYQEQWFARYHEELPDRVLISTESFTFYRRHGDDRKPIFSHNPQLDPRRIPYAAGSFIWAGIDYLGEAAAGWPLRGWNGCPVDATGHRRPVSWLIESIWSDRPLVHIAVTDDRLEAPAPVRWEWGWPKMVSHWTLPNLTGETVKVWTFSNCDEVELFLNGRSLGVKRLVDFPNRLIEWQVPCAPGNLLAVGRRDGRVVANHLLKTAGPAAKLRLAADRSRIRADGRDLFHVELEIRDAKDIPVPGIAVPITWKVSGPGHILGLDNGNLRCAEPYQGDTRSSFDGRALAIVQSTGGRGAIRVTAQADGLRPATVTVRAK